MSSESFGTNASTTSTATGIAMPSAAPQCATFGDEAAGPDEQDRGEQQHDGEVAGPARAVVVRVLLDQADGDGGDRRAADRAEAADHDDDEGEDQERGPAPRVDDAEVDAGEHARERGQRAAEREDDRERAPHVDPERAHHRAVLDPCPDHEPEARVAEERGRARGAPTAATPISTKRSFGTFAPSTLVVSIIQLGTRERLRVGAPDALDERAEREREADGDEHLLDGPPVERPDEDELDERRHDDAGDDAEERRREAVAARRRRRPGRRTTTPRTRRR